MPSAKKSKLPSHQVFGVFVLEVNKVLQATPSKLRREMGMCATTYSSSSSSVIRSEFSLYVLQSRASRSRCSIPGISGRVDMLTSPVPAARAAVATGAWVESKHDMYLIHTWKCGSLALFLPIRRRMKKEKRRSLPGTWCSACKHPIDYTNQRYGRLSASA